MAYDIPSEYWDSDPGRAVVRRTAIHEAGHAVAMWHLDRMRFMGRKFVYGCPEHIAVSFAGEAVATSKGGERDDIGGVVAGGALLFPFGGVPTFDESVPASKRREMLRWWRRAAYFDITHVMAGPIAEGVHDAATDGNALPVASATEWLWEQDDIDMNAEGESDDCGVVGSDGWQVRRRLPYFGRRWRLHLQRCFDMAAGIVRDHQPHINALADELLARRLIPGEEAWSIFDAVGPSTRTAQPPAP